MKKVFMTIAMVAAMVAFASCSCCNNKDKEACCEKTECREAEKECCGDKTKCGEKAECEGCTKHEEAKECGDCAKACEGCEQQCDSTATCCE